MTSVTGILFYRFNNVSISTHMMLGLITSFYMALTHTICMFHLIGTGKDMKEASTELPEYTEVLDILRSFKQKAFPYATFAIIVTIFTVLSGGGSQTGKWSYLIHQVSVIISLALNLIAFVIELKTVRLNWALAYIVDLKKEGIDVEEHFALRSKRD